MEEYLINHLTTGRIQEISDLLCDFFNVNNTSGIRTNDKLDALCIAEGISPVMMDEMIAHNPPAIRTIKGHSFEVIFSKILQINDIPHNEIGGDTDYDFEILGSTLQLKTPYVKGCSDGVVSYKTHKTHGAKSESESYDYYHKVEDFADYLVGLISYDPFEVIIIPKEELPRLKKDSKYIDSPVYIDLDLFECYINNFEPLGVVDEILYPSIINLSQSELLPLTAATIGVRSNYIIDAIYKPENFRIWDMNLRGFIREKYIVELVREHGLKIIDPKQITDRPEKVDLALQARNRKYVRFQIKGITASGTTLKGLDSSLLCETQLSRGRVNDHPTQSRLYAASDFDKLLIAVDPFYTNQFSLEINGISDYGWSFYAVPVEALRRHHKFSNRLASSQNLNVVDLQQFRIDEDWFNLWL